MFMFMLVDADADMDGNMFSVAVSLPDECGGLMLFIVLLMMRVGFFCSCPGGIECPCPVWAAAAAGW